MKNELTDQIPHHVALIMDGNRRWAKDHHVPLIEGHRRGALCVKKLIRHLAARGVHTITIWIFSTENWNREPEQVKGLMKLFEEFAETYFKEAQREGMRIIHLGRKDRISEKLRNKIVEFEEITKHFDKHTLNIALDHGGRDEIIRAIARMSEAGINLTNLTEDDVSAFLDTAGQKYPNPDIIIRTGGEQRASGFMAWQGAYAEYFFTETLLPDLTTEHIDDILKDYVRRHRRFGA